MKRTALVSLVVFCLIFLCTSYCASSPRIMRCTGQTVYVAASFNELTVGEPRQWMLSKPSIRNVDPNNPITLTRVDFYNPKTGEFISLLEDPAVPEVIEGWGFKFYSANPGDLGLDIFAASDDKPFFIIEWQAEKKVIEPMITGSHYIVNLDTGEILTWLTHGGRIIEETYGADTDPLPIE